MLGKLYKYDMKGMGRLILPLTLGICGVSVLCTVVVKLLVTVQNIESSGVITNLVSILATIMGTIFVGASAVSLIAYPTVSILITLYRYYSNFFTDEGYLTFTLPVKTKDLLLSKFLSILTYSVASICVTFFCFSLVIFFGTSSTEFFNTEALAIITELSEMFDFWVFGDAIAIVYVISIIVQGLFSLAVALLAITVGAIITKKYKIIAAIGINYAITTAASLVSGIFSTVITYICYGDPFGLQVSFYDDSAATLIMSLLIVSVLYLGFGIAAYVVTHYILKNKLNLQ